MKRIALLKHPLVWSFLLYVFALILAIILSPLSQRYLNEVFQNALASYAATRGLNALVSIMQESSLSAGFFVEGNLAIGQILDPVNDLLERFSGLLLLSLASVGVQKFLLSFGASFSMGLAVFSFVLGLLISLLSQQWAGFSHQLLQRGIFIAIFLVLFVPFMGLIGSLPMGLNQQYEQAQTIFQETRQSLEQDYGGGAERRWFEGLDLRLVTGDLQSKTELLTANIIDLIVVFAIQTIVLPLVVLLILWQAVKSLASSGFKRSK